MSAAPVSLDAILYWHWWIAGLVFLTLEAFVPGAIFLWMGVSAMIVGVIAFGIPVLAWPAQFIIFGVLSIATVFAWRRWRPAKVATDQPTLNRRGESYVGRQFTLGEAIVNGVGTLRVDDSQWRISASADAPAGTQVRVVAVDGTTLRVERLGQGAGGA